MLPNLERVAEPKIIKRMSKDEMQAEGFALSVAYDLLKFAYWYKIRTVRGTVDYLLFTPEDEWEADDDYKDYSHGYLVAIKDGWEYQIEAEYYTPSHANGIESVENIYDDSIDAVKTKEPDDQPNIIRKKMEKSQRVMESFEEFTNRKVNEEDMVKSPEEMEQPCEGCDHSDTLSEKAKNAIKNMCNTVLIHEAHLYESSDNPDQTYESFLREATHYMAECLIRAAQNLKV